MQRHAVSMFAAALFAAAGAIPQLAGAVTVPVDFNVLNASATLATPFVAGDSLRLDTLVTTQTGALNQSITFTLASGINSLNGQAAWEVNPAAGTGPRLTGVNIDIFDASNVLVTSDTLAGTLSNFALSTFSSVIGPGTYKLVATGTGVRDSSLDVTLNFVQAVPLPAAAWLLLSGAGALGVFARRRKAIAHA
jgi:hypothetical protein